jgi:hypothetical protein
VTLPEFMDTEEVLERLKQIGTKYPDLSGTFAEMQEKHLKRTKLRKDTPTALSNAKKNVEVFQSRMDELIALMKKLTSYSQNLTKKKSLTIPSKEFENQSKDRANIREHQKSKC